MEFLVDRQPLHRRDHPGRTRATVTQAAFQRLSKTEPPATRQHASRERSDRRAKPAPTHRSVTSAGRVDPAHDPAIPQLVVGACRALARPARTAPHARSRSAVACAALWFVGGHGRRSRCLTHCRLRPRATTAGPWCATPACRSRRSTRSCADWRPRVCWPADGRRRRETTGARRRAATTGSPRSRAMGITTERPGRIAPPPIWIDCRGTTGAMVRGSRCKSGAVAPL